MMSPQKLVRGFLSLANELALPLLELCRTPASIPEESDSLLHIGAADHAVLAASCASENASGSKQLQRVAQTDLHTLRREHLESLGAETGADGEGLWRGRCGGLFCELRSGRGSELQTRARLDDCADFRRRVRVCGDDEESREEIGGNAVCADEAGIHWCQGRGCAANGGEAAVGGEDYDGRDARFQRAVEVGKAFNVKHVDL